MVAANRQNLEGGRGWSKTWNRFSVGRMKLNQSKMWVEGMKSSQGTLRKGRDSGKGRELNWVGTASAKSRSSKGREDDGN